MDIPSLGLISAVSKNIRGAREMCARARVRAYLNVPEYARRLLRFWHFFCNTSSTAVLSSSSALQADRENKAACANRGAAVKTLSLAASAVVVVLCGVECRCM